MEKKNLLIIGATSGIIISCLDKFLEKEYNILATYHNEQNLQNIPDKIKNSKRINFLKLDLSSENEKIINVLKQNKVKADFIIYAVGGSFGERISYGIKPMAKNARNEYLGHILINNYFLNEMKKKIW